jgi:hypothetical protein
VLSTTTRTVYTYDLTGRLVREERTSISNVTGFGMPDVTTWVYDDNGNVLSENRVGPSAGGTTSGPITGSVDAHVGSHEDGTRVSQEHSPLLLLA